MQELEASPDELQAMRLGWPAQLIPRHRGPARAEADVTDRGVNTAAERDIRPTKVGCCYEFQGAQGSEKTV
jgi:hypothetical protein